MYDLENYSKFWTTKLSDYELILFLYQGEDAYVIRYKSTGVIITPEDDLNLTKAIVQKMLEQGVNVVDIRGPNEGKVNNLMITRPQADEYAPYYGGYINRVPEGSDVLVMLNSQPAEFRALLKSVTDEQANVRPAPGEWSIKEVVGHMCDTERIFAYRALRIARGDTTPLPGFEQDDFVRGTDFNTRTLADLLDEFEYQRRANVLCFKALTPAELERRGTASNGPMSVRAAIHILAGHVLHHSESLKVDYKVGG